RESFFGGFEGDDNDTVWGKVSQSLGYKTVDEAIKNKESYKTVSDALAKVDSRGDAETFEDVIKRVKAGIHKVYMNVEDKEANVLIVTHGNVIRKMAHEIEPERNVGAEIGNGNLTAIVYDGENYNLEFFNKSSI
ncbi:MAG: histidine phosphatase family protein, partial [Coprobacillaceae bacterium]